MKTILVGGKAFDDVSKKNAWNVFEAAVLLELDGDAITRRLEYRGGAYDEEAGISRCFKAGTIHDGSLYTVTNTEVVRIDLDRFEIVDKFSHRLFNDLHHVNVIGERLYVVSTGIDEVLEFTMDFRFVDRFATAGGEVISRFGPDSDFRLVPYTKPHEEHPNFVTAIDGRPFATCLKSGTLRSLDGKDAIAISDDPIHDGIPHGDSLVFTTVTGKLVTLDTADRSVATYDINKPANSLKPLGWCRGLDFAPTGEVVVGFSKLRQTPNRENISVLKKWAQQMKTLAVMPTRLVTVDTAGNTIRDGASLNEKGIDAIFSVHVMP